VNEAVYCPLQPYLADALLINPLRRLFNSVCYTTGCTYRPWMLKSEEWREGPGGFYPWTLPLI